MDLTKDPYYQLFNFDYSKGICDCGIFSKSLLKYINKINPKVTQSSLYYKKLSLMIELKHHKSIQDWNLLFLEEFGVDPNTIPSELLVMTKHNEMHYLKEIGLNDRYTNEVINTVSKILCISTEYPLETLYPFIKGYIYTINAVHSNLAISLANDLKNHNENLLTHFFMKSTAYLKDSSQEKISEQLFILENAKKLYFSDSKIA